MCMCVCAYKKEHECRPCYFLIHTPLHLGMLLKTAREQRQALHQISENGELSNKAEMLDSHGGGKGRNHSNERRVRDERKQRGNW